MDKSHDKRNKIKRVALIALQVLTCGLALFGLFGAISCVRSCSTTPPTSSVASRGVYDAHRRNAFKPEQNLFIADGSSEFGGEHLSQDANDHSGMAYVSYDGTHTIRITPMLQAGTYVYRSNFDSSHGDTSFYRVLAPLSDILSACEESLLTHQHAYIQNSSAWVNYAEQEEIINISDTLASQGYALATSYVARIADLPMSLVLVDTLRAPADQIYDFSNGFNGASLIGGKHVGSVDAIATSSTTSYTEIDLQGMLFRSAGTIYDGIRVAYMPVTSEYFIDTDGNLVTDYNVQDSVYLFGVYYHTFGWSGSWQFVAGHRSVFVNRHVNTPTLAVGWGLEWVSPDLMKIEVLDTEFKPSVAGRNGKTNKFWLSSFVDRFGVTQGGTLVVDGQNPVDLLSKGFSAWSDILAIQLLPNISIGLLIFIPLIVTIILVIVRLLQK